MQARKAIKSGSDFAEFAEMLKAAAHPERIAILHLLSATARKPMNVKSIYEALSLEQSVVSKHLGIMKRCGLLQKERKGNTSTYMLNRNNNLASSMISCLKEL